MVDLNIFASDINRQTRLYYIQDAQTHSRTEREKERRTRELKPGSHEPTGREKNWVIFNKRLVFVQKKRKDYAGEKTDL